MLTPIKKTSITQSEITELIVLVNDTAFNNIGQLIIYLHKIHKRNV